MQAYVIINNIGIVINNDLNVKNWLINVGVIMDLFGILVYVNMNVIDCVMLVNTWIMWIVNP